jgi:NAD(P)H-flavin reductase
VRVDVAPEQLASHRVPGQYAYVEVDGRTGYFALANREGKGPWEFLLRDAGGASEALVHRAPGDVIRLSGALGGGFPVDGVRGGPLSVVVTAGAIGAVRALLAQRVETGDAARTVLYLGTRTRMDVPIPDELERFAREGVRVQISLSEETAVPDPGFFAGFVQAQLERHWDGKSAIFLAGFPAMLDAVREVAAAHGAEGLLFFNH